jgi:hypothetical protein
VSRPKHAPFSPSSFLAVALVAAVLFAGLAGAGGAANAETIRYAGSTGTSGVTVVSQDRGGVTLHFEMSELGLDPVEIGGRTWTKVSLPGTFLPNDAGKPDLPGIGRFVAVPRGATATLEILAAQVEKIPDLSLAPAPIIPKETENGLHYTFDDEVYGRGTAYPASPVLISAPGQMRGVDCVTLGITPFSWDPASRDLTVYRELDLRVSFVGGTGTFGEERLRSRYWEPILQKHLANYASLPHVDFNRPRGGRNGFEYVIICPDNQDFIAWADTLKSWRKLQGISTEVFTTSQVGITATAIETWLNNAYNTWDPAPDAFLILGDYPYSGFRDAGVTAPIYNGYCVSDNIYADVNNDHLPDMVHARITARNPTELSRTIGKMMEYERHPYTDAAFYDHPIIAGGWQTERWFILCTEIIFGHQANVLNKHPVREYAIYDGTPGTMWSTATNTSTVVSYFGPDGLGYIPATPQHLTDWGGNATRINADINAGGYMLLHRDHGAETGWGEPAYYNSNLSGLNNDRLPFVFSMNCLTGKYNYGSECFTEAFHRMAKGALGLVAASEISYSFVNDALIWGMFDTMWPGFMPASGPYPPPSHFNTDLRPAFGLASGKYFLQSSSWPYNSGDKQVTYHLFHHHGDAFLTMYSEVPLANNVTHGEICFIGTSTFPVQADAGAVIALTVDGEIVGVADATGLPQEIALAPQIVPGDLRITVTLANHYRYDQSVPILPPAGPYLVHQATELVDESVQSDGILQWSESAGLVITMKNVGVDPTTATAAELTSIDPFVSLDPAQTTLPGLPPGASAPPDEPFGLTVSGTVPDLHPIPFTMHTTSPEGSWTYNFILTAQAPILQADALLPNEMPPLGDGDGVVDPGESFLLQTTISNSGHADAMDLAGTLSCENPFVVVTQAQGTCDHVPAGGQGQVGTFEVQVLPSCPSPSSAVLHLALSGPGGFVAALQWELSVGPWFDDAEADRGWTLGAPGDNATSGQWIRAEPIGTTFNGQQSQPEYDHTPSPGSLCFVTGNGTAGGPVGEADVDGGKTTLLSPIFNAAGATGATISYWRWYTNNLGNNPGQDYWTVEATADGTTWAQLEHTTTNANQWTYHSFDLNGLVPLTGTLQFRFVAQDPEPVGLVEAAVDDINVSIVRQSAVGVPDRPAAEAATGIISCRPNPLHHGALLTYRLGAREPVRFELYDTAGRRVRTLGSGTGEPGEQALSFQATDHAGRSLPSGIYFLRMATAGKTEVRQITILR